MFDTICVSMGRLSFLFDNELSLTRKLPNMLENMSLYGTLEYLTATYPEISEHQVHLEGLHFEPLNVKS